MGAGARAAGAGAANIPFVSGTSFMASHPLMFAFQQSESALMAPAAKAGFSADSGTGPCCAP
jgi:hypothetical protein